jgi:hypothetical protein
MTEQEKIAAIESQCLAHLLHLIHKTIDLPEISVIGLGSIDEFSLQKPQNATLEQLAILDQVPLQGQTTYTFGVSWRRTLDKGFWQLVASRNYLRNEGDKFEGNDNGNENKRILRYRSRESENRLRYELNIPAGDIQMNVGANLILVIQVADADSGAACNDRLETLIGKVISLLLTNDSLSGLIEQVKSMDVSYQYNPQSEQGRLYLQTAFMRVELETQNA